MFSPEASIQSARSSLRNPRRRQRTSSEGLQAQQPRRKRNKLTDESFVAKDDAHVNGNGSALMNGHVGPSSENSLVMIDMPVREKKTPPKRSTKEDNALYLVRVY
jgi:nuclear pore complex protein Nup133